MYEFAVGHIRIYKDDLVIKPNFEMISPSPLALHSLWGPLSGFSLENILVLVYIDLTRTSWNKKNNSSNNFLAEKTRTSQLTD